jgi:hypothetical protein
MTGIEIRGQLGDEVVTREHGAKLRALVEAGLNDSPVVVDFGGLQIASVSFFDEAFGQLALRCGEERLLAAVEFRNIDPFDAALVHDIIRSRAREADKRKRRTG